MDQVMLERMLEARDADGKVTPLQLQFMHPYLAEEEQSTLKWRCRFRILGIGSDQLHTGIGLDAMDALLMSFQLAEVFLSSYETRYQHKITWLGESDFGLRPLPPQQTSLPGQAVDSSLQQIFEQRLEDFFKSLS